MDITYNIDPVTVALLSVGVPVAYALYSNIVKRISRIESFLSARFGDPHGYFKPKNGL
jgi:hypothetical protein